MSSFGKPKFYDAMLAAQEDPAERRKRIAWALKNGAELKDLTKTFPLHAKVRSTYGDEGIVTGHGDRSVVIRNSKTGVSKPYNPQILKIIS